MPRNVQPCCGDHSTLSVFPLFTLALGVFVFANGRHTKQLRDWAVVLPSASTATTAPKPSAIRHPPIRKDTPKRPDLLKGLGENECIFMIATVGLSVDYTVRTDAETERMRTGGLGSGHRSVAQHEGAKEVGE